MSSSETLGKKDAQQWACLDVEQALDRRAVGGHPLGLARFEPDAQLVSVRVIGEAHDDTGRLGIETDQLAFVSRPR